MTRKEQSKIICSNLIKNFDWLKSQETTLVSVVMDSLKPNNNRDYSVIMGIACDDFCKHRNELEKEELEEKCKNCTLAKMVNSRLNLRFR